MTHDEYVTAVEAGNYPTTPYVPPLAAYEDARGTITNLMLHPVTSVAEIRSKRGTVRANHYHRTDWHYAYVVSGKVAYFERAVGDAEVPAPDVYGPGQMFFTPPNREHAMLFLEDTVIITLAKNVRDHATHEADLVRVEVVSPATAARYL